MRNTRGTESRRADFRFAATLAVIIVSGALGLWFLFRPLQQAGAPEAAAQPAPPSVQVRVQGPGKLPSKPLLDSGDNAAASVQVPEWEQQISDLITSDKPHAQMAVELLGLIPKLPPEGQEQAAQHAMNLIPDEAMEAAMPYLLGPQGSREVKNVIFTDILNRPNAIKLPALLRIIQVPNHPEAEEARNILELFLNDNYGSDWTKWRQNIDRWLKENS